MSSPTALSVGNWHGLKKYSAVGIQLIAVKYKMQRYRRTGLICAGVHEVACLPWSPSLNYCCLNMYCIELLLITFPYEWQYKRFSRWVLYIMLWLRLSSQCRRKELCNFFFSYLYEYCGLNGVDILYCTHT